MSLVPIAKPEWLPDGIKQMETFLRLHKQGLIPEKILGWMLVVDCMRLLRAVYGDDLTTAAEIRKWVLEAEQKMREAAK